MSRTLETGKRTLSCLGLIVGLTSSVVSAGTLAERVQTAFESSEIVFLSDPHGNEALVESYVSFFEDLELPPEGLFLVAEFLNPVHQDRLDRFFLDLEPMTVESLSQAWYDTSDIGTWGRDDPSVRALVEAVRRRNRDLEPARRIRVLGGSAPIDWGKTQTIEQLTAVPPKNRYVSQLIAGMRECGKPILVLYGVGHLLNRFWREHGPPSGGNAFFALGFYKVPGHCGPSPVEWFHSLEAADACLATSPLYPRGRSIVEAALTSGNGAVFAMVEPGLSEGSSQPAVDDPELDRRANLLRGHSGGELEDLYRKNARPVVLPGCR